MTREELTSFEALSCDNASRLVGGFSAALPSGCGDQDTAKTNNCNGGNYKAGCGGHDKKRKPSKPVPNSNCKGNCVKGCGTVN